MYLVYTEYVAHCVHDVVLGICENINEVIEIIWNYSRMVLKMTDETFEENGNIINIAIITKEDYNVLDNLYKKYEEDLDEYKEKSMFCGWKPEILNTYFWYGVFDSEEKEYILFSEKDCEIIKNIIQKSTLLE